MKSYPKQILVAALMTLSMFSSISHNVWPSSSIPMIMSPGSNISLTMNEISWISSIIYLGGAVGSIFGTFLANRVGRKPTLVFMGVPNIISCILIICAEASTMLLLARFIAGCALGVTFSILPMYMGEIASIEIRGFLGSMITMSTVLSTIFTTAIGSYNSIRVTAGTMMIFPAILLLSYFWVPETPYYYLIKQREKEALESLKYLRGSNELSDIQKEIDAMQNSILEEKDTKVTLKDIFQLKGHRKGLLIAILALTSVLVCGEETVNTYMQKIFKDADGIFDPKISSIILNVIMIIPASISGVILDKVGRRPLILLPLLGTAVTNGIMAGYFYVKDHTEIDVRVVSWLPIITLGIFYMLYISGISCTPDALLGELFTMKSKTLITAIVFIYFHLIMFLIIKLYDNVATEVGNVVPFSIFCIFSIAVTIALYFILPETKGRTMSEIQFILNNSSKAELTSF